MIRMCQGLIVLLVLGLLFLGKHPLPAAQQEKVKLVVLLVFDQMRGDYLGKWKDQFGKDGFQRLTRDGVHFTNCHYPYAHTVTAAGHATMVTGCLPNQHGIVGNSWYDRKDKAEVASVNWDKYRQFPPPPEGIKVTKALGVSPERRLKPSVADMLKDATKGKAKVVSLSIKERAAALMASLLADFVYWLSPINGSFVTSSFYRDTAHKWVEQLNQKKTTDQFFGKDWTRSRPDLDYDKLVGPDDVAGESKGFAQGMTFPHPTTGGLKAPGTKYYEAVGASPFGSELLFDLAKQAVVEEKLGQGETPDLLLVSVSCNDLAGHLWGPDSQEVFDITLRSDRMVADFLTFLDDKVGKDRYALVMSSDHGVSPLPDLVLKQGRDAGRLDPEKLAQDVDLFLDKTYGGGAGKVRWLEEVVPPWFYLNQKALEENKLDPAEVEKTLCAWLDTRKGIRKAYSRHEMMKGQPKDNQDLVMWRSFHPDRSGDVELMMQPHWLFTVYLNGTTHGSPYTYDTHVPLVVYGPGLKAGSRDDIVTPLAVAPILAHFLGVDPPPAAQVGVPENLFKGP